MLSSSRMLPSYDSAGLHHRFAQEHAAPTGKGDEEGGAGERAINRTFRFDGESHHDGTSKDTRQARGGFRGET
ncbi:MAG: hypothetical protein V2A73_11265 [Pseudomonadota bacterium]